MASSASPSEAFAAWRQARQRELAAADSWLGLIGLFWLVAGRNRVGSGADCPVRLPSGPAHLGDIEWHENGISWQPAGEAASPLQTDRDGQPTIITCGTLAFFVVEREGKLAVRLRDRNWAATRPFAGLAYFDFDPAWQIEAQWQALPEPRLMLLPNVSGEVKNVEISHQAVFAVQGQGVSLLPVAVGADEVFFVFRDQTSGRQSYGAGRFLKAAPAVDGRIVLDFNRAFNPPCALTSFATCPLPPPENWLPFAVPAGEMKPPDGSH